MQPQEFMKLIKTDVRDPALERAWNSLVTPSSKKPSQREIEDSEWFNKLPDKDKDRVRRLIREAVDSSFLNLFCVLDGVATPESMPIEADLELYYTEGEKRVLINNYERWMLHDMYMDEVSDFSANETSAELVANKSLEELLEVLIENAIIHEESTEAADPVSGNRAHKRADAALDHIVRSGKRGIEELKKLLSHEKPGVRYCAAASLLPFCEEEAMGILKKIKRECNLLGLHAEITIKEWKEGNLKEYLREKYSDLHKPDGSE